MMADDSGVIRFQIELDHRAEQVEFRFWEGGPEPLSLETVELRSIGDKKDGCEPKQEAQDANLQQDEAAFIERT